MNKKYSKGTIEGDKKTEWICGCFQTAEKGKDGHFHCYYSKTRVCD